MSIKQFNGRYLPSADRILVKANTDADEELALFLSRRVVRQILSGGEQKAVTLESVQRPGPASAEVARFKREALRQTTDFKQPYQGGSRQTLGDKPELVLDAVYSPQNPGQPFCELVMNLRSGRKLTMKLPQATLQALCLLLEQLQEQAEWDLLPKASAPAAAAAAPVPGQGQDRLVH